MFFWGFPWCFILFSKGLELTTSLESAGHRAAKPLCGRAREGARPALRAQVLLASEAVEHSRCLIPGFAFLVTFGRF